MNKSSPSFIELLNNENRSLDISEYELYMKESQRVLEKEAITTYLIAVLLFCVGLWGVYEHAIFLAVLVLSLALYFNQKSSISILALKNIDLQRVLAMLINKQSRDIESLRMEIRERKS